MTPGNKLLLMVVAALYFGSYFLFINSGEPELSTIIVLIIGLLILEAFALFVSNAICMRCIKCGKFAALEEYSNKLVETRSTTMTEEKIIQNSRGQKIGSIKEDVAATEFTRKRYLRCKYCGYETFRYTFETYKN